MKDEKEILKTNIIKTLNTAFNHLSINNEFSESYQNGYRESFMLLYHYIYDTLVKEKNINLLEDKNLGSLLYLTSNLLPTNNEWKDDYITGYKDAYYLVLEYLSELDNINV